MKKIKSLIVGSGTIGAYLSKLLIKKNHNIVVTSRFRKKKYKKYEKLKISKKPDNIFYFAGQSSIPKSYELPKETFQSNFTGAKNFLEIMLKNKIYTNFFKANSGYIFKPVKGKINLKSKFIKPKNAYVSAQQKSYKIIKKYRKKGLKCSSLIFMQIDSPLREKSFFLKYANY